MIRLPIAVLIATTIFAVIFDTPWLIVPAGLFLVYEVVAERAHLRCYACRKRLKIGATACHHCGRSVAVAK